MFSSFLKKALLLFGSLATLSFVVGPLSTAHAMGKSPPQDNSIWSFSEAEKLIHESPNRLTPPVIVRRKDWDARRTTGAMEVQRLQDIHTIVIHNTETPRSDESSIRDVVTGHMERRGWTDVGYHFLIARDSRDGHWKVYEGRPIEYVGAHAGLLHGRIPLNRGTIGIALAGSYSWRTEAKKREIWQLLGKDERSTQRGRQKYQQLLSQYADPSSPEAERQPPRELVETLLRLIEFLMRNPKLPNLHKIRAHGALAATELRPGMSSREQFEYAINPDHTDCPGHGMIHLIEALQKRYE